jgi:hypothetical protein
VILPGRPRAGHHSLAEGGIGRHRLERQGQDRVRSNELAELSVRLVAGRHVMRYGPRLVLVQRPERGRTGQFVGPRAVQGT